MKNYTVRLGEFCHYITDFFCYAHSIDFFKKNLGKHFLYEIKAHKKISMFKGFFTQNKFNKKQTIHGSKNLIEFLLYHHTKYKKNWRKPEHDFIYTLKICPVLINNILVNDNKVLSAVH